MLEIEVCSTVPSLVLRVLLVSTVLPLPKARFTFVRMKFCFLWHYGELHVFIFSLSLLNLWNLEYRSLLLVTAFWSCLLSLAILVILYFLIKNLHLNFFHNIFFFFSKACLKELSTSSISFLKFLFYNANWSVVRTVLTVLIVFTPFFPTLTSFKWILCSFSGLHLINLYYSIEPNKLSNEKIHLAYTFSYFVCFLRAENVLTLLLL